MLILLIDDELTIRTSVAEALTDQGHEAYVLDSSNSSLLQKQLAALHTEGRVPDLIIMDGHNVLRDTEGNALFDMTPLGLLSWLYQQGISKEVPAILFSNDNEMVKTAKANQYYHIWEALPKLGREGGLKELLKIVQKAAVIGLKHRG